MQSELLIEAYVAEREQARYYRALSVHAEAAGNEADIEALNGLVADEQHHVSRIKTRVLELGLAAREVREVHEVLEVRYDGWQTEARQREQAEIQRYERLLEQDLDPVTRSVIESILETERLHEQNLGGKYTQA